MALRRTILSDIPVVVFRTSPEEENNCIIDKNTTRFNNEIVKQRLSCIPICIADPEKSSRYPFARSQERESWF